MFMSMTLIANQPSMDKLAAHGMKSNTSRYVIRAGVCLLLVYLLIDCCGYATGFFCSEVQYWLSATPTIIYTFCIVHNNINASHKLQEKKFCRYKCETISSQRKRFRKTSEKNFLYNKSIRAITFVRVSYPG